MVSQGRRARVCLRKNNLGYLYQQRRGGKPGLVLAIKWYRKAIAQGNHLAELHLGFMYDNGYGIGERGSRPGRRVVSQGRPRGRRRHRPSQPGNQLRQRHGCFKQDYAQAVRWYRRAAEQGNAQAQYNLGSLYEAGNGVKKDLGKAIEWFRKAAKQGYLDSSTANDGWRKAQKAGANS